MPRLYQTEIDRAIDFIEQQIRPDQNWNVWTKRDFNLNSNENNVTNDNALILCRVATEEKIKSVLERQSLDDGLNETDFELLTDSNNNERNLPLNETQRLDCENEILLAQDRTFSLSVIRSKIGGFGGQNDGWRARGFSYSTCRRFLRGENIGNETNFNFLCNLVNIECDKLPPPTPITYPQLEDYLENFVWREADRETARILYQATEYSINNPLTVERIRMINVEVLRYINNLWLEYSDNVFGLSVQSRIYIDDLGATRDFNRDIWRNFGYRIGWRDSNNMDWIRYDDLNYSLNNNCEGHLPRLTVWNSNDETKFKFYFHALLWYVYDNITNNQ